MKESRSRNSQTSRDIVFYSKPGIPVFARLLKSENIQNKAGSRVRWSTGEKTNRKGFWNNLKLDSNLRIHVCIRGVEHALTDTEKKQQCSGGGFRNDNAGSIPRRGRGLAIITDLPTARTFFLQISNLLSNVVRWLLLPPPSMVFRDF